MTVASARALFQLLLRILFQLLLQKSMKLGFEPLEKESAGFAKRGVKGGRGGIVNEYEG